MVSLSSSLYSSVGIIIIINKVLIKMTLNKVIAGALYIVYLLPEHRSCITVSVQINRR